ncbi:MAG: T9SS type A sorting domain-containing protein [Salinivirgaceae bacterium]|nr:T9SS type A sorting domain-containing protein [Salinivirgaceae bacterium]
MENSIYLLDSNGVQLQFYKYQTTEYSLDLTAYPNGLYFVKIVSNSKAYFMKIMKI